MGRMTAQGVRSPRRARAQRSAFPLPPAAAITAIVGNFGSGKTETALNYALALARAGERVKLVDLDIINPYFRSREAREFAAERGVEVIAPAGDFAYADLPILMREVWGALGASAPDGFKVVLDVGGDDLGARVLGGFANTLRGLSPALWQVVNERRPFTDSLASAKRMHDELRAAARLAITGLVANAHLIHETTPEVVRSGIAFTRALGAAIGVPLMLAAVEQGLLAAHPDEAWDCPVLPIERLMTSPWEGSRRRGPIGVPPRPRLPANVK